MNGRYFFCLNCNKKFFVTESEYKKQRFDYKMALDLETERAMRYKIAHSIPFILNGHSNWIYRENGNYSKEMRSVEK